MKALKQICIAFLIIICTGKISAQVGINTVNPDPNAVLDINSADKGIKLPSIKNTSVLIVPSDSSGYLIYHVNSKKFRYWNGNIWESVNPLDADTDDNIIANKKLTVNDSLILNKPVRGNSGVDIQLNDGAFIGDGTIPVGGIIMWKGTTVPTGWAICDGFWYNPNNNTDKGNAQTATRTMQTPDLRGRFVVGYVNDHTYGNTNDTNYPGGKNTAINSEYASIGAPAGTSGVTLQTSQLPTHNHDVIDYGHNHAITGEIMQKEGSSTQRVVALDTEGDPGHGAVRYTEKIENSHTGVTTRNTGGNYTYTPMNNPTRIIAGCSAFQYICSTNTSLTFKSSSSLANGTEIEINGSQSYQLTWAPNFYGYQICIPGKYYCGLGFADISYGTGTISSCVINPNYDSNTPDCINDLYDPRVPVGDPIRINESWTVQSHENRPPYYVLAFIMRIR